MASEFEAVKRHGRKCFCSECLQDERNHVEDELAAEREKNKQLECDYADLQDKIARLEAELAKLREQTLRSPSAPAAAR